MGLCWLFAGLGLWQRAWGYFFKPSGSGILLVTTLGIALIIGWSKSKYVLANTAHKFVQKAARTPYAPPLTVLNIQWIFIVLVMSGIGIGLRTAPYDPWIKSMLIANLYPGIGGALMWSSFILLGWRNHTSTRFDRSSKTLLFAKD